MKTSPRNRLSPAACQEYLSLSASLLDHAAEAGMELWNCWREDIWPALPPETRKKLGIEPLHVIGKIVADEVEARQYCVGIANQFGRSPARTKTPQRVTARA